MTPKKTHTFDVGLSKITVISSNPITPEGAADFEQAGRLLRLAQARQAVEAGNRSALTDAVLIVKAMPRQEWPGWLFEALAAAQVAPPEKVGRGRTANAAARRRACLIDAIRADCVDRAIASGLSKRAACLEASAILGGDPAGTARVMEQSHTRFHRRSATAAADYYPFV